MCAKLTSKPVSSRHSRLCDGSSGATDAANWISRYHHTDRHNKKLFRSHLFFFDALKFHTSAQCSVAQRSNYIPIWPQRGGIWILEFILKWKCSRETSSHPRHFHLSIYYHRTYSTVWWSVIPKFLVRNENSPREASGRRQTLPGDTCIHGRDRRFQLSCSRWLGLGVSTNFPPLNVRIRPHRPLAIKKKKLQLLLASADKGMEFHF